MDRSVTWERIGAAAGIAFVALLLASFFVIPDAPPALDDPVGKIRAFYVDNSSAFQASAYLTGLGNNWESFYLEKRSSATRRRDRTKRKRLGDMGEVHYLTPADKTGIEETLAVLVEQKSRAFARMGVSNLFDRPGVRDFFIDLRLNFLWWLDELLRNGNRRRRVDAVNHRDLDRFIA